MGAKLYRRRESPVEAMQVTSTNVEEIAEWVCTWLDDEWDVIPSSGLLSHLTVQSDSNMILVSEGDWVVRAANSQLHAVPSHLFFDMYEEAK